MKRTLLIAIMVGIGWYGNYLYRHDGGEPAFNLAWSGSAQSEAASFTCDGRAYCSQMTSCEEAMYFIAHCPGTKMDGDRDGIPCERQWCD